MPRIQWSGLPPALRDHLFERLRERKITAEDLYQLKLWRESNPEAPDGLWYKDFGSLKICGEGKYPKTFLLTGQAAKGQKLCGVRAQRQTWEQNAAEALSATQAYPAAIAAYSTAIQLNRTLLRHTTTAGSPIT